jgi:hypothetical protein
VNVFFSYTVRDNLVDCADLRRIARRLEGFSSPYIDLLEHRCGGHQPSVWKALNGADAFLLCVTPCTFESPWVMAECATALELGLPFYAAPRESWLSIERARDMPEHLILSGRAPFREHRVRHG